MNLLALGMTAGAVVLAVLALSATTALSFLTHLFPSLSGLLVGLARVLSYAVLVVGAGAAAAMLYRYGPDRDRAKWSWITPGSIFAAVTWMILTLGFGFYVSRFGNYNKTYGSLATIVILVTWIWLSAYVFLFGAELNSELEHQTAKDTTEGSAKPLGARGAWSADHVASNDEPQKPSGGASPPNAAEADQQQGVGRLPAERGPVPVRVSTEGSSPARDYAAARLANRTERFAGLQKVGMISSAAATTGLALLRKKGRAPAGMALLATAAGLALLKRED